ncbi:MAG: class I SAM-dependent methyltransferase [Acidobacteriota bacterium]|nr:class I SAM-dependent methyltransferase [Acidobacteriota bacterium]
MHWLGHRLGLARARTQTTEAERRCLAQHARGRRSLVEIGVMHGVGTRLLREVMHPDGTLAAIDPFPPGRLGISFERLVARREAAQVPRGRVIFDRRPSRDVAAGWTAPVDFLFIDGDHSRAGIEADWQGWRRFIPVGGLIALHDSRAVPGHPVLDSVRYTEEVILPDPAFTVVDAVDSLTMLQRVAPDRP